MRAVVYHGPKNVSVDDVPDARIERPTDALIRITTTNICGSDLHMYEGRTDVEQGKIFGHENLGEVIEVGTSVDRVKVGDMVCLPFNIGCGFCKNCEGGLTGFCLTTNPGSAGAAYGYASMGPYNGGQAELLRVPYADWNALVLPEDAWAKENDYAMLSDILPTGYHGTELAQVGIGDSVAIWGAGPVGLMAAMSAMLCGADQVFVVDHQHDRLKLAEALDATRGEGADRGVEAVGYQAHDHQGNEKPGLTINSLIQAVRPTGRIVSHELNLDQAAEGYQHFDDREDGWIKVLLHP